MGPSTRAGGRRNAAFTGSLTALAVAQLAITPGAGAAEGWGKPTRISDQHQVRQVEYAAGPDGYAIAVWSAGPVAIGPGGAPKPRGRVFLSRRDSTEDFGEPILLGRGDDVRLAMAPGGETIVSWRRPDRAAVTVSSAPGEPLGEPTLLAERPAGLTIDVADGGYALAAWRDRSRPDTVLAAIRESAASGFGAAQPISSRRPTGTFAPAASVAGREALVAWTGRCPANTRRAKPGGAAFASGDGVFGAARTVRGSRCPTSPPETEIAPSGRAYLLLNGRGRRAEGVRTATRAPGGVFGAMRASGAGSRRPPLFGRLTSGVRDGAIAVWETQARRPVRNGLAFARSGPSGFASPRTIAPRAGAGAVDVASSGCGSALIGWQPLRSRRFHAATIVPGEGPRRFGAVGPKLARRTLNDLSAGIGSDGRPGIAWTRDDPNGLTGNGVFVVEGGASAGCRDGRRE